MDDQQDTTDSTVNLLSRDAEIRRSSTFGLLEEEKQGSYKLENDNHTYENIKNNQKHTDGVMNEKSDIIPEVEESIELTGFSLEVTAKSTVSLLNTTDDCHEQLKSKSFSHIETATEAQENGQLVRWHSQYNKTPDNSQQVVFDVSSNDYSSKQSLNDQDYFNITAVDDAVRKSMEDLLNQQQSNSSSHTLDDELESKSQENIFY